MSTRHSRVANREALACPNQAIWCGVPMRTRPPGIGVADPLRSLTGMQTDRNVDEGDGGANRGPTRVRIELNDPRQLGLKAANKIGSGNIAGVEHASDSDGDRNSNDTDGPVPIDSHSSLSTRH
jgi:hypothetical protein